MCIRDRLRDKGRNKKVEFHAAAAAAERAAIGKGNNRKKQYFYSKEEKNMKKRMKALAAIALSVCMLSLIHISFVRI